MLVRRSTGGMVIYDHQNGRKELQNASLNLFMLFEYYINSESQKTSDLLKYLVKAV